MTNFTVGLVQMCSGRDVAKNCATAVRLIEDAAARSANYVQTPECTTLMETDAARLRTEIKPEVNNQALQAFSDTAKRAGIWLHIGSMAVALPEGRLANRSYLFAPDGSVAAKYDKIHMFDVDLGGGELYRESDNYAPGDRAVVTPLPWGSLGMAICYDLRFPGLFRTLAHNGAKFIAVPAAFTRITGEAHWHTLLRARAIESQCFVFASAQGGRHENGRETFGHSLMISPWGKVLAEGSCEPGVLTAVVDLAELEDVRRKIPSLTHDRTFTVSRNGPERP